VVGEAPKTNGAAPREVSLDVSDDEAPPLRRTPRNARIAEWSLVLEAAGIPHLRRSTAEGWELHVAPAYLPRARQTLDAYDRESARPEPSPSGPWVEPYGRSWIGFAGAVALVIFYGFTGPSDGASSWSRVGSSAA